LRACRTSRDATDLQRLDHDRGEAGQREQYESTDWQRIALDARLWFDIQDHTFVRSPDERPAQAMGEDCPTIRPRNRGMAAAQRPDKQAS